ncbi:MAG: VTT domain-containing protein [Deferrisomatales bacterium]|nr:VTT domain-containing protein [Deferrisomatales bacterium]
MRGRPILLAGLLALGVALGYAGVLDHPRVRELLGAAAGQWWTPPALVAAMTGAYAFALPGSALILPTALLYPPPLTAGIAAVGGGLGALWAYHVAGRLGASWVREVSASPAFGLLRRNSGFPVLCALRVLPAFPHSFINYGAGLLRVPRPALFLSAVAGLGVKGYLYAAAVQQLAEAGDPVELANLRTLWPLLALALLLGAGWGLRRWWEGNGGRSG